MKKRNKARYNRAMRKKYKKDYYSYTEEDKKRFWGSVDIKDDNSCWEWKKSLHRAGYGYFSMKFHLYIASRMAFIMSGGILTEEKKYVCHTCDNSKCCNPKHLWAGSAHDNYIDALKKGRVSDNQLHYERVTDLDEWDIKYFRKNLRLEKISVTRWCKEREINPTIFHFELNGEWNFSEEHERAIKEYMGLIPYEIEEE